MTVIIPKKVYQTIVAAAVRYANVRIPFEEWLEVSGIFIGKNEGNEVYISEAYPIMHQTYDPDAIIDKYIWSDEDYISLSILDEEAFSRGEFTVGWWHSHPGFKVMLSGFGDLKTTLSFQSMNPLAIALVFNPQRLIRQVQMPDKKGDPIIPLENDPGFKIFRLDDPHNDKSPFHEVDYLIEGYENAEHMINMINKFIINITNFFPKDNLFETYEKFVKERIHELDSKISGTEEYLKTLMRQGESNRIPEVLENQQREIRKYVAETFIKIENIKEYMDYLEYKERDTIIPKVKEILSKWDENIKILNEQLSRFSKKF